MKYCNEDSEGERAGGRALLDLVVDWLIYFELNMIQSGSSLWCCQDDTMFVPTTMRVKKTLDLFYISEFERVDGSDGGKRR